MACSDIGFKLSNDPQFAARLRVGLYVNPSDHAHPRLGPPYDPHELAQARM